MYANVNQKACIQCGLCPSICPEVFSLDDGAPAHAITDAVPEEAEILSPVGALRKHAGGMFLAPISAAMPP